MHSLVRIRPGAFRVQSLKGSESRVFRVWGFRVQSSGYLAIFRVWGFWGSELRVFRVRGFRVQSLKCLGFGVLGATVKSS